MHAKGSSESQKLKLRRSELMAAQKKCRDQIAFIEKRIAAAQQTVEQQTGTVADGGSFAIRQALNRNLAEIEERQRELAAFRKRKKTLQAEIDCLALTPAQAARRAKDQAALASVLTERHGKDLAVNGLLERVRKVLEDRAQLSVRVLELAARLDFAASADFDTGRFEALSASLPQNLISQSREWLNWFFGQEKGRVPYTVGSTTVVLPETLASANVFRPGETAYLTPAQIAAIPADQAAKRLPTPEEMEATVKPRSEALPGAQTPETADSIAVSGFPLR
jgi:hypothetical protein